MVELAHGFQYLEMYSDVFSYLYVCIPYYRFHDQVSTNPTFFWRLLESGILKNNERHNGQIFNFLRTLHYSKSQIFVQKIKVWQKFTIFSGNQSCQQLKKCKSPTFSRVFRPKFFWQFFSWNQSCQWLKSPKLHHFHEFFHSQKINNFLAKSKLNFGQKRKISNSVLATFFLLVVVVICQILGLIWAIYDHS